MFVHNNNAIALISWQYNPIWILLKSNKALKTFESMFLGGGLERLSMLLTSVLTNCLSLSSRWQIPSSTESTISAVWILVGATANLSPFSRPRLSSSLSFLEDRFLSHRWMNRADGSYLPQEYLHLVGRWRHLFIVRVYKEPSCNFKTTPDEDTRPECRNVGSWIVTCP